MDRRSPTPKRRNKYERKALALPGITYRDHFYVGFQWPYTNSKGTTYLSTLTDRGWICECVGFTYHGKCKHIVKAHQKLTGTRG